MKNGEKARKRVKELIEKGKSKGVLTYTEIMDMLEEIDLEPDQIEKIYDTLETLGIDVVDERMILLRITMLRTKKMINQRRCSRRRKC